MRLLTAQNLEVDQRVFLTAAVPRLESQQRRRTVVAMRVHRPVRKHDVRVLRTQEAFKCFVACVVDLARAVDLPGEDRLCAEDPASF